MIILKTVVALLTMFLAIFITSPGFIFYLKRVHDSIPEAGHPSSPFHHIKDFRQLMTVFSIGRIILAAVSAWMIVSIIYSLDLNWPNLWCFAAILILTMIIGIFSESIGEVMITSHENKLAPIVNSTVLIINALFFPITRIVSLFTPQIISSLSFLKIPTIDKPKDFDQLLEEERARHQLVDDEKRMIDGILELHEMTVREVMVPRIDVEFLEKTASIDAAVAFVREVGYSRIPVYDGTVDNIVGILYAKDLLEPLQTNAQDTIASLLRPAHFVPDSKEVTQMLGEFKLKKVHVAIVVDEYGGTAGIITLEDILEEIVGEIQDEHDQEQPLCRQVSDTVYEIDAKIDLDDLSEIIGHEFDDEDETFETLGGLIFDHLGRVPDQGEELEIDGFPIKIIEVDGRRISWVQIALPKIGNPDEITPEEN